MTILVTNDDGYGEGLRILLEVAKSIDKNAYALIPDRQKSAVSKALTLHKPHRIHDKGEGVHTLNGTPADCVLFSIYSRQFAPPSMILSGINYGDNTTLEAMLSSGTLGACWEAAIEGIPAIAFSLYKESREYREKGAKGGWGDEEEIKKHATEIVKLLKSKAQNGCFFSVNFPSEFSPKTKVVFVDKVQKQRFKTIIEKRLDPYGKPYYWLGGDFTHVEKGTDLYEVAVNKNVSVAKITLDFVKY